MELRQIRSFLSIAETLHFGRSAKLLHMSQPALTLQIKALEDDLGVQLLSRSRQGTLLTEAGKAFRLDAEAALARLDFAKRKAQWADAGKLGRIHLGFVASAGQQIVPKLLSVFRERYPDVEFSIRVMMTEEQMRLLAERSLDVGFLRLPVEKREEVTVKTIYKEPFVAILPPGHPLAAKQQVHLSELRGNPFILYEREYAPGYHDLISGLLNKAGLVPKVIQTAGEMSTLVSLVDAGIGVSIVPASVPKRVMSNVTVCQIADSLPMSEIGLAFASANRVAVVRRFLDLAAKSAEWC